MEFTQVLDAGLSLPSVFFGFLLVVVVVYWLLVVVGGPVFELPDDRGSRAGRLMCAVGLGGLPVSVAVSLLIVQAWAVSVVAALMLDDGGAPPGSGESAGVAVLSVLVAWLGAVLLVRPVRRLLPVEPESRPDHVGDVCIVRTGWVGPDFGQAEVTGLDGSAAIIQVRQRGGDDLHAGSTAVIDGYDRERGVFWVSAFDPELGTSH
ncbi:hypothetical protein [Haloactinopolyspora alba]|uniref:hypothetical protein n=1 Tax=Haloactinopolyspora alba TaxID=648780 RepID=UPI0013EE3250